MQDLENAGNTCTTAGTKPVEKRAADQRAARAKRDGAQDVLARALVRVAPRVVIAGRNATVAGGGNKYIAATFVEGDDEEGIVEFTVSELEDAEVAGNVGVDVTSNSNVLKVCFQVKYFFNPTNS